MLTRLFTRTLLPLVAITAFLGVTSVVASPVSRPQGIPTPDPQVQADAVVTNHNTLNITGHRFVSVVAQGTPHFNPDLASHGSTLAAVDKRDKSDYHIKEILCGHDTNDVPLDSVSDLKGVKNVLDHLFTVSGTTTMQPGKCERPSCAWGTGVWWCNHNKEPFTIDFTTIGHAARQIRSTCEASQGLGKYAGQMIFDEVFSVLFRATTKFPESC